MKIRFKKKGNGILALITLGIMIITKMSGNIYAGGLGLVFGLAVAASIVTDMIGDLMRKRKEEDV
ncbi:hypothetical protein PDN28_14315 [Bacillus cereus]|uniref:hypothetical protein n=1 Tax=Bacillus cereus TaxID=1396 RepID=UPI002409DB83|nr:hypothetical protein [Bacillus cereus]MCU4996575.1 hypothetical protein [Bacillus cereus]MDA2267074.1 hypothetical protein [Bacillus cereus]MDC7777785.1 hypothetical protein [Bacillus cereus]